MSLVCVRFGSEANLIMMHLISVIFAFLSRYKLLIIRGLLRM